jgi:hypothetical protein
MLAIPAPGWMATEDRKKVFQLLAGLPDRECEDHIERGGERAYELLEANEAMLRAVADSLAGR